MNAVELCWTDVCRSFGGGALEDLCDERRLPDLDGGGSSAWRCSDTCESLADPSAIEFDRSSRSPLFREPVTGRIDNTDNRLPYIS